MNRQVLDLIQEKAMPPEQLLQGGHGEVAEVLVIDGVKLAVVHQVLDVGNFDHRDAVLLEENAYSLDKTVEIRNVG